MPHETPSVHDAGALLDQRIQKLRTLSWQEALRLPDRAEEEVSIGGMPCALTTHRQAGVLPSRDAVLVTVRLERPRCFGALTDPLEQGLVFEPHAAPRLATAAELRE